jgi:hypothetical protein
VLDAYQLISRSDEALKVVAFGLPGCAKITLFSFSALFWVKIMAGIKTLKQYFLNLIVITKCQLGLTWLFQWIKGFVLSRFHGFTCNFGRKVLS